MMRILKTRIDNNDFKYPIFAAVVKFLEMFFFTIQGDLNFTFYIYFITFSKKNTIFRKMGGDMHVCFSKKIDPLLQLLCYGLMNHLQLWDEKHFLRIYLD